MDRRKIVIIIVLVLILGTGILYFLLGGKTPSGLPLFTGSPFGTPPEETPVDGGITTGSGNDKLAPDGVTPVDESGKPINALYKISDGPIAGAVSFKRSGVDYIRYVDRATGHVIEIKPSTLERSQILNITRPQIYEAIWRADATGYIERTVASDSDEIINTSISLVSPVGTSTDNLYTARATLLRGDVGEIVVTPDGSLLYNLRDTGAVMTSTFAGEKPRTLFTLPFTSWRILPISNASAILATKPSSTALGYAYNLNLQNGGLTKILGPLSGLSVLPTLDGKKIAYGRVGNKDFLLSIVTTATRDVINVLPQTLPEKCVWSKKFSGTMYCGAPSNGLGTNVPDSWYQGIVSYSDKVLELNPETETAQILTDPKGSFGVDIDVINPMLSPNEDYLFFTNKNDLTLWVLRLVP